MKQPLNVVVVDDEAIIRMDMAFMVEAEGHRVVGELTSGRELVDLCSSQVPDLIITDITMPVMNGIDAMLKVRETLQVPVIFVSGEPFVDRVKEAFPDAVCLKKPFGEEHLRRCIAQITKKI